MIEQLKEQIKVVAKSRQRAEATKQEYNKAYEEWLQGEHIVALSVNKATASGAVQEVEAILRELTLQIYVETGNKAPAEGVGIRERTVLTYDGKVAFDWAKAHKMALKLDTSAFEKIAKADPPDFVKITSEPQATIATNLDNKIKG